MSRRSPFALHLSWALLALVGLGLWSLSAPPLAQATIYWASSGGGGSCNSSDSPCSLSTGLGRLGPGHTLYLRGGDYSQNIEGNNYIGQLTGSEGNPATIASAPGETATIYGYINIADPSHQYIILDHLVIDGTGRDTNPLSLGGAYYGGNTAAHHITFQNGEVRNSQWDTSIPSGRGAGFSANVQMLGHHNSVLNSNIHHARWSFNFYLSHGHHNTVDNCDSHDSSGYGVQIYNGDVYSDDGFHVISNNLIHDNGFRDIFGAVTLGGGYGTLFFNNVIYNNNGGVDIRGDGPGLQMYNNTFYGNIKEPVIVVNGSGASIINNIFYNNANPIQDNVGSTQENNTFTNPSFTDAGSGIFTLQPGSNSIGNGTNFIYLFTTDIAGTQRPASGNWDRGAYQSGIVSAPLPAPTNLRLLSLTP